MKLYFPSLRTLTTASLIGLGMSHAALASQTLAQKNNCLTCHQAEKKQLGPSIKSLAEKYKGADDKKIAELTKKVREGGVGTWGQIPMPANTHVSQEDAVTLVRWMTSGSK